MTHGTIEETFDYRMTENVKVFCKQWDFTPKSSEELFDFLEEHSQNFAKLVMEDMVEWAGEEFWFAEIAS